MSDAIGKYMRPRSLLIIASTPIFSLTSSAAVCSNPVGTVAPMVTVMTSPMGASFSEEEEADVQEPGSASPSSWEDMLYEDRLHLTRQRYKLEDMNDSWGQTQRLTCNTWRQRHKHTLLTRHILSYSGKKSHLKESNVLYRNIVCQSSSRK